MGAGVSLESQTAAAAFSATDGTWDADYPVENLGDLDAPSKVGRVTGGTAEFVAALPATSKVGIVALVNHTLEATDTVQVVAGAYDSGVVAVGAVVAGYRRTRPFIFPEVDVDDVTVTITFAGASLDIGAVEIARFWQWRGISPGAEVGFADTNKPIDLAGGARLMQGGRRPRVINGQLDRLDMTIAETRGLDFQYIKGRSKPFVFVRDTATPDSWARGCFLARNTEVPPSVGAVYRHDTWQFRFKEHFG